MISRRFQSRKMEEDTSEHSGLAQAPEPDGLQHISFFMGRGTCLSYLINLIKSTYTAFVKHPDTSHRSPSLQWTARFASSSSASSSVKHV